MSAIDFSKFKKTGQDKKCATLVHPDGHEIKIAIANLTPALRKELEKLPLHQAEGSEAPVEPMDNESPAKASDAPQQTLASNDQTIPNNVPQGAPSAEEPVTDSSSAPAAPEQAPAQQPAAAPQAPPPTPEQEALQKTQEHLKFGEDLSNGHITPKTYGDLFAEKSTLGKVKTLFGLLLSGMGAGLTHQPNALLSMMDRQIQNDLEAQKTDQSNKQNWFKLSMEHTRNQTVNALTSSEAYLKASEADKQHMINNAMGVANHEASVNAKNSMLMAYLQDQQNTINKMPPGPTRDAAQAQQNNNMAVAQNQMYQNNLAVAQQKHNALASAPAPQAGSTPKKGSGISQKPSIDVGPINQKAYQDMLTKGKFMSSSGFVDPSKGIDPADNAAVEKAITDSNVNWKNYKDVIDVANEITKMPNAGQTQAGKLADTLKDIPWVGPALSNALHVGQGYIERPRDVLVNSIKQRLAAAGSSDKKFDETINSLTPNMFDDPKSLKLLEEAIHQHYAHNSTEQSAIYTKYPKIKNDLPRLNIKGGQLAASGDKRTKTFDAVNKLIPGMDK